MSKTKTYWQTPMGEFPSANQACRALHCDRTTLYNRVEKGQEGYARIERAIEPRAKPPRKITGVQWPVSWFQYRVQDNDTREAIYLAWCHSQRRDPDEESTANAFFDEMDQVPETEDTDEQAQPVDV